MPAPLVIVTATVTITAGCILPHYQGFFHWHYNCSGTATGAATAPGIATDTATAPGTATELPLLTLLLPLSTYLQLTFFAIILCWIKDTLIFKFLNK